MGAGAGASAAEVTAMRRAIVLATRGLGATSPNPIVGAVVLDRTGAVAGEGFHERAGGPHAEVLALAAAGARAAGGTVVVTLEPCAHSGRTGPCTAALRAAGVARVVYGVDDPDPRAGGGAGLLRAAGITVVGGVLAEEAAAGNEAWLTAVRRARPFVTWKYAASLDGQVAAADGSSRWITSASAREDVHLLRAQVDAIIAGRGTVAADDPSLTARPVGASAPRPPVRVVVDSRAALAAGRRWRVFDTAAPTLLAATTAAADGPVAALRERGVDVIRLPATPAGVDLVALLAELFRRGLRSVLVEGGPTLAGSFIDEGLVDRVVGYLAPVLLGSGRWPALRARSVPGIAAAPRLRLDGLARIGPDLRITARPVDRHIDRQHVEQQHVEHQHVDRQHVEHQYVEHEEA